MCPGDGASSARCRSAADLAKRICLVYAGGKFEKAKDTTERKAILDLYLENTPHINNWDLVDTSAEKILGSYLLDKDKGILYEFANSRELWKERIAVLATFHFIKRNEYHDTLEIFDGEIRQ